MKQTGKSGFRLTRIKFFQLLWVTMLMVAANNICLFADSVICSRLCGQETLVAIQMSSPVLSLVNFFYWMLGIGGSLLCFNLISENKKEEGDKMFATAMIASVLICLTITIICNIFCEPLIDILCPRPELHEAASLYLRIYSLAFPFLAFVMTMGYFMRADGVTTIPFFALLATNVTNIIMDNVLITYFGMGIDGAALASVLGYIVGSVITCLYFFMHRRTLRFRFPGKRIFSNVLKIEKTGFSSASTQIYYLLRSFFLNKLVGHYNPELLTPITVFMSTLFIPYIIYIGLSQTMSPMVSLFYTEKDYDAVKYVAKKTLIVAFTATMILAFAIMLFPESITSLFNISDSFNMKKVIEVFRVMPISYVFSALSFILLFYLQAIGRTKLSSILSLLDSVLLIVIDTFFFGVWLAFIVSPVIVILIYVVYSWRKKAGLFLLPKDETSSVRYEITKEMIKDKSSILSLNLPKYTAELCEMILLKNVIHHSVNVTIVSEGDKRTVRIRFFSIIKRKKIVSSITQIYENAVYSNILGMHCITISIL